MEFTSGLLPGGAESPVHANIAAGGGVIRVEGVLRAPDACHDLRATATRSAEQLVLTVLARKRDAPCGGATAFFSYRAILREVPRGSYRFQVRHTYEGTQWPDTAIVEEQIVVE